MPFRHPLGGSMPGRPWNTTGYGPELMTGQMVIAGLAFDHSGVGPDSVSVICLFPERSPCCTVAAFSRGADESANAHEVARFATQ